MWRCGYEDTKDSLYARVGDDCAECRLCARVPGVPGDAECDYAAVSSGRRAEGEFLGEPCAMSDDVKCECGHDADEHWTDGQCSANGCLCLQSEIGVVYAALAEQIAINTGIVAQWKADTAEHAHHAVEVERKAAVVRALERENEVARAEVERLTVQNDADLGAHIAEIEHLRARQRGEVRRMGEDAVAEHEGAICPEDVGCAELVKSLELQLAEANAEVERLRENERKLSALTTMRCACGYEVLTKVPTGQTVQPQDPSEPADISKLVKWETVNVCAAERQAIADDVTDFLLMADSVAPSRRGEWLRIHGKQFTSRITSGEGGGE